MSARRTIKGLFRKALEGVDPRRRVAEALARPSLGRALAEARRVGVFACGKAAAGMVLGLPRKLRRGALVVLPNGYPAKGLAGCQVLFSAHPEPDSSSMRAARRAIEFFDHFSREDAIVCLVSGGTSSLLALPRSGVTLASKRAAVRRLMRSGASIVEINRLRKKLSAVKGGRLGQRTRARLVTLVLSDVPGDDPALVGSGPTIRGGSRDITLVIGSNRIGLEAAALAASESGLQPRVLRRWLSGEAREQGARFARQARLLDPGEALLAGGETAVTISGRRFDGRGGRNLEFALGAANGLDGVEDVAILSAGSDGVDGSSRAAGAVVDGRSLTRARQLGLDPARALDRHDTEPFFDSLGDLVVPGPTGTNVCDWAFALRRPR
ncbi:MAG TPA: DUF4147 domain-containing protein [Thermoanaerobaculia bacterium]|nr:DUF4147 domain-containing protein [Thermoanaerobaculia bacterium]